MKDRFRLTYSPVSEANKQLIVEVKSMASNLESLITDDNKRQSREISIALTKLEEAIMWAVKDFTNIENQVQ